MDKKRAFIDVIDYALTDLKVYSDVFEQDILNAAFEYFESLKTSSSASKEITENGLKILTWMQENQEKEDNAFTAKSIAEGLFTSGRSVAGSMKKLVNDEFVKKLGGNPAMYALTEKGQEYKQS